MGAAAHRKVVATYCFEESWPTGSDEDIEETLEGIAAALGREDEAAATVAEYGRGRRVGTRRQCPSARTGM